MCDKLCSEHTHTSNTSTLKRAQHTLYSICASGVFAENTFTLVWIQNCVSVDKVSYKNLRELLQCVSFMSLAALGHKTTLFQRNTETSDGSMRPREALWHVSQTWYWIGASLLDTSLTETQTDFCNKCPLLVLLSKCSWCPLGWNVPFGNEFACSTIHLVAIWGYFLCGWVSTKWWIPNQRYKWRSDGN